MAGSIKFYFISVGGSFGLFMEKNKDFNFLWGFLQTYFHLFFLKPSICKIQYKNKNYQQNKKTAFI